jgi:hypothetical protein
MAPRDVSYCGYRSGLWWGWGNGGNWSPEWPVSTTTCLGGTRRQLESRVAGEHHHVSKTCSSSPAQSILDTCPAGFTTLSEDSTKRNPSCGLYRPTRPAKLVPTFAGRACFVVSAMGPYGRSRFFRLEPLLFHIQIISNCNWGFTRWQYHCDNTAHKYTSHTLTN